MKSGKPLQRKTPLQARAKPRTQKRAALASVPGLSGGELKGMSAKLEAALFTQPKQRSPLKTKRKKLTPLQASARDEGCTLNIAGVCKYDSATVVLCHLPFIGGSGGGMKTFDFCAAYGCDACHGAIDNRTTVMSLEDRLYYGARGLVRTLMRMAEKGLVVIKGEAFACP